MDGLPLANKSFSRPRDLAGPCGKALPRFSSPCCLEPKGSGPGQVAGGACRRAALREMPQCAKEIHGVSGLCFCTEGLKEGFIKKTILEQGFGSEKVLDLLRG